MSCLRALLWSWMQQTVWIWYAACTSIVFVTLCKIVHFFSFHIYIYIYIIFFTVYRQQEKIASEREDIEKQRKLLVKKKPPSSSMLAKNSKHENFLKPGEKWYVIFFFFLFCNNWIVYTQFSYVTLVHFQHTKCLWSIIHY